MKRKWVVLGVVVLVGLLAWGVWLGVVGYKHEHEKAMWARTPGLGFNFTREFPGSERYCFQLGYIKPPEGQQASSLRWEQFYFREYRPDGPREYAVPGLSGEVRMGQKTCGFSEDGYYDLVYRPTGYLANFKYPECGGDPKPRAYTDVSDRCWPPRDWPQ